MRFAVTAVRFLKNRDEHRRNVLQEIFRFGTVENLSVLLQLVCDLINDKPTASCECVMGLLEERALQESFEEKGAHRKANSHPLAQHCPVASALGRPDSGSLGSSRPKKGLTSILEFIMLWPSEMSCPFSRELVIFPHA